MGKRSNFERIERDFYPTPFEAVEPLIPHLPDKFTFAEPCAGDGSLTRHLSDNYANAPQGLFGTLKISQISHNNLNKFSPSSLFTRFIKRISYIAYHLFRFNLKI